MHIKLAKSGWLFSVDCINVQTVIFHSSYTKHITGGKKERYTTFLCITSYTCNWVQLPQNKKVKYPQTPERYPV